MDPLRVLRSGAERRESDEAARYVAAIDRAIEIERHATDLRDALDAWGNPLMPTAVKRALNRLDAAVAR
jgi:hypothetical protein